MNGELRRLETRNAELQQALQAEASARAASELATANQRREESEKRQALTRQTNWQWLLLFSGPFIAAIAAWIFSGGLAR